MKQIQLIKVNDYGECFLQAYANASDIMIVKDYLSFNFSTILYFNIWIREWPLETIIIVLHRETINHISEYLLPKVPGMNIKVVNTSIIVEWKLICIWFEIKMFKVCVAFILSPLSITLICSHDWPT